MDEESDTQEDRVHQTRDEGGWGWGWGWGTGDLWATPIARNSVREDRLKDKWRDVQYQRNHTFHRYTPATCNLTRDAKSDERAAQRTPSHTQNLEPVRPHSRAQMPEATIESGCKGRACILIHTNIQTCIHTYTPIFKCAYRYTHAYDAVGMRRHRCASEEYASRILTQRITWRENCQPGT
jgi:hypothetical protein